MRSRAYTALSLAALAYAGVLSAATLHRHSSLESGGYDLGIFEQGVWLLGHGHAPFSTIRGRNLFADHFQPALALFAPLGTADLLPTGLLVFQAAVLAAAALPLAALARERGAARGLAAAVAGLWLASPLVQWANLFDFHPETAVPLLLVGGALLLERGRVAPFVATAVAACCFKEDVALVYLVWGCVLALTGRRRFGIALAAGAASWFVLVTKVLMPRVGGNLDFYSKRFAGDRGSSVGSVFTYVVEHPLRSIEHASTTANAEILLALTACTGGLALLAPRVLALALPPVLANVLSAYPYQHDLHLHYEIVPVAIFAIASAYGAGVLQLRGGRPARLAPAVLVAGALAVTAAVSPALKELRRGPVSPHIGAKLAALATIPRGASVAAAPDVVAHVAGRREVYMLPEPFFPRPSNGEVWSNAELRRRASRLRYVVYSTDALTGRLKAETEQLPSVLRAHGYRTIFTRDGVRVFRR